MSNVLYVASVKDIPLGARVRYPGKPRVYVLIDKALNGVIAEWQDDPPRGWIGQGVYGITDYRTDGGMNCLSFEMEVLRG